MEKDPFSSSTGAAALDPDLFSRQLTWSDALRFEKQDVHVLTPEATSAQVLCLRVSRVTESPAAPGTHQFAIVFHGPADTLLGQGTYHLVHPELGDFAVFITPVGRTPAGVEYEACFTHVV
ncbi:hypothetical protein [Acidovorax sp. 1608163]|uniref:DUF6916 family protein n=1 Tax=Acidovorax sp. 1608163 TaxID=2478662 RepID=UPI001F09F514|nr:hypothetical protein [Acidovorax sp. 1608163]